MGKLCRDCRAVETPRGGRCPSCRRAQQRRRKRERIWIRAYTRSQERPLRAPVAAQGWRCLACGHPFGPERLPLLAYALPLARGGADSVSNRVALCRDCLDAKGERTFEEWEAAGGPHVPWTTVTAGLEVVARLWTDGDAPAAVAGERGGVTKSGQAL